MDLSKILGTPPTNFRHNYERLDETTCSVLCQHPSCWASIRRQEKGIPHVLPPLDISSDDSDDDTSDLPTQSVCNLLGDYGSDPYDRFPVSTGGRPSHHWAISTPASAGTSLSRESRHKHGLLHGTTHNTISKDTRNAIRNSRMKLVEVQEVFDRSDLNSQWDETFVTKQYYVWVPNPQKSRKKRKKHALTTGSDKSQPVLMKDLTECMVPSEIEQKREETVLKKQPRTRSPPSRSVKFHKSVNDSMAIPSLPSKLDTEGINELLALPKDTLMKVLEQTKKSDFTSKGKLHSIVEKCAKDPDNAQGALNSRSLLKHQSIHLIQDSSRNLRQGYALQGNKPVFQLDDDVLVDRASSVNSHLKDKECSEANSVDSFPRYKKPLPRIAGSERFPRGFPDVDAMYPPATSAPAVTSKIPSISLGLPELPSGVKTTKAFLYKPKDVDFSLGPVLSPPSTVRSTYSGDYSDHGTTLKVHAPSSVHGGYEMYQRDQNMAIHSVSPALSTHVPQAPAGTPATFQSPTKSAPTLRDFKDVSRDPTQFTLNSSQQAHPPSCDIRDESNLSSPGMHLHAQNRPVVSPMDTKLIETPEEQGLDTINETAREGQDGSLTSSRDVAVDNNEPAMLSKETVPKVFIEMKNGDTKKSPRVKSGRSVESCPSPEAWPLISELSFEKIMPRPSVSEPALSARSDRRRGRSRSFEDGSRSERSYARKVLDEKFSAESPAPPPPSPEPKDSNSSEKSEYRSRKDLKSRDSLSMAPLFEVSELEEGSLVLDVGDKGRRLNEMKNGKRKQVKKIHAVIPQANMEVERKVPEDDGDGEMISQMTVMHVTPRGRDPNAKKKAETEKVQEIFLNVDIPAEEISSIKAEHGSSHQEDISSNDTVVKSHSAATESEVSATAGVQQSEDNREATQEVKGEEEEEEEDDENNMTLAAANATFDFSNWEKKGQLEDNEKTSEIHENLPGNEENFSTKLNSEASVLSPELFCDSARFLSHDLVSPVEGEEEGELENESSYLPKGLSETQTFQSIDQPSLSGRTKTLSPDEEKQGKCENFDDVGEVNNPETEKNLCTEVSKDAIEGDEIEAPGSFFFGKSSSFDDNKDENNEQETFERTVEGESATPATGADNCDDGISEETKIKQNSADGEREADGMVDAEEKTDREIIKAVEDGSKNGTNVATEGEIDTELKTEGENDTELKTEGENDTELKTEGENDTEMKTEGDSDTEMKTEGENDTELKTEGENETVDGRESSKNHEFEGIIDDNSEENGKKPNVTEDEGRSATRNADERAATVSDTNDEDIEPTAIKTKNAVNVKQENDAQTEDRKENLEDNTVSVAEENINIMNEKNGQDSDESNRKNETVEQNELKEENKKPEEKTDGIE